jgi:molybdopterin molybdotransferase
MKSVDQHLSDILAGIEAISPLDLQLLDAHGCILSEAVVADVDLPAFDNSSMDGYAVRMADVAHASDSNPVTLPVVGDIAAGSQSAYSVQPGLSTRIMTGAPIPAGAEAVVPIEWTDQGIASVSITRAPKPGQYIRRAGEDVRNGELVLDIGTRLGPGQIGLLAAVGRDRVKVRPRPRVVILSTGSELVEPGQPTRSGQIHESNSYILTTAAREAGATVFRVGIVPDDPHKLMDAIEDQLIRADLVLTSGGVSVGAYDVVKEVLSRLGTVAFEQVAMQPGKPQGFGFVGEDATPIITLPGNPVSSYVSFEVFVLPALRRMMGRLPYRRPMVRALCSQGFSSAPDREQYVRAQFGIDGKGAHVTPVGGHGSHLLGDLSEANALIVVPAAVTSVQGGSQVQVLVLDRDF